MGDERKKVMLNDPSTWPEHSHAYDAFTPTCARCQIEVMASSSPVVSAQPKWTTKELRDGDGNLIGAAQTCEMTREQADEFRKSLQAEASHPQDERERFEAWATERYDIVEKLRELFLGRNKYDGGKYNQSGIEESWQAWQAALASRIRK